MSRNDHHAPFLLREAQRENDALRIEVRDLKEELARLQAKWADEGNHMYVCEYGTFYWKGGDA